MSENVVVSVVMPVYNEERYIENCIDSLLQQDFPKEKMEWIFVDGCSKDNTLELLSAYRNKYPELIKICNNSKRVAPSAMNIGILASRGKYVVRLDAHASFAPDYISKCVYYLDTTDADNVGGVAETEATGFMGSAIAKMLSSKFGVGNSQFRTNGKSGYVDTVPFGAFRREVFDRVGFFNEKLIRSEDNDMNSRIRENGGKIWLSEDIKFKYYCRDTVGGILKMGMQNGNALFRTLKINPRAMSLRHFIPFLFFVSLVILPVISAFLPIFWFALLAELVLYLMVDVYFSFCKKNAVYGLVTMWLYPLFHVFYGLGSMLGLFGVSLY